MTNSLILRFLNASLTRAKWNTLVTLSHTNHYNPLLVAANRSRPYESLVKDGFALRYKGQPGSYYLSPKGSRALQLGGVLSNIGKRRKQVRDHYKQYKDVLEKGEDHD